MSMNSSRRTAFEQLEERQLLAFSAPNILIAEEVGHLETVDRGRAGGYRNLIEQSSGKIVVAGSAKGPNGSDDFYLARYRSDIEGFVLDTTFGDNGVVTTNFASGGKPSTRDDILRGAAVDSQDRIVAVGSSRGSTVIARYSPDGHLDTSFSLDGYDMPANNLGILDATDNDWRVAFDSNDGPVVAGVEAVSGESGFSFVLYRYDVAGNFDSDFGLSSTFVRDEVVGSRFDRYRVADIAVYPSSDPQHGGKIVVTGGTRGAIYDPAVDDDITRRDWTVLRFNTDGTLDPSFADNGVAVKRVYVPGPDPRTFDDGSAAQTSYARGVLLELDGRIVVSGFTAEGMTITRYNADGSYDESFNPGGIQPGRSGVYIPALGHVDHNDGIAGEFGTNIAKDAGGNYIVGGTWVYRGGDENDTSGLLDRFAFAKFRSDGSLDTEFGDNGSYLSYVGAGGNRMVGLVANSSGEIWASGYDANRESILFRFPADSNNNLPPTAVGDAYEIDEDSELTISQPGVLANDSDADDDALIVTVFDPVSAHGAAVSMNHDGSFSYDPQSAPAIQSLAQGESLNDTFSYTVSDGHGGTDTGLVTITVTGLDEPTPSNNAIYVYDIRFESKRRDRDWRAVFDIRSDSNGDGQADANDSPRAGVDITVTFAGNTYSGVTDSNGIFRTSWIKRLGSGDHYANAADLALAGFVWVPLGIDAEDDSDGDGKPDDLLTI